MKQKNLEIYQENNIPEEYSNEIWELFNEINESKKIDKYPYISEQDYKKYFSPETYNFKQFNIWSCRFVSSIYGITRMKCYKNLIINSVKKDENENFIIKIPLSIEKTSKWTRHKIDISVYQNQRTINWSNPKVLKNDENNMGSWNGIIAFAMAVWEEITWRINFDINRLESWDPAEMFLDWRVINGISLKEKVEYPDVRINKLKDVIWKENTIITASVKQNNDWSFETITWDGDKSNHSITITKIINENNNEYIQYYDPNDSWLKKILVNDFLKKCYSYKIFCKTDNKYNYNVKDREKPYYEEKNRNTPGMVVENTWEANNTLRKLRWDLITYKDGNKTIVESRGKKTEIIDNNPIREQLKGHIKVEIVWNENMKVWEVTLWEPYRSIRFPNSKAFLNIDRNKLLKKYEWEKDKNYQIYLYLTKIANFMNRMIYNYIDTKAWNKNNNSPFSLNKLWWLVLDDDPYHVDFNTVDSSQRENIKRDWEERKKEKEKIFHDKLICLRDRSKLGIDEKETEKSIVEALNNMVREKFSK